MGGYFLIFFESTYMSNITAKIVPNEARIIIPANLFKIHFPFKIEPTTYQYARMLSNEYQGAYWQFYSLSNEGFFMVPEIDESVSIACNNGYEGQVSKEAFGIIVCLYTYSYLSFTDNTDLAQTCIQHYHRLRDFALEHAEADAILEAID